VTEQTHRESSCWMRSGCLRIRRYVPHDNPLATRRWKISNHYTNHYHQERPHQGKGNEDVVMTQVDQMLAHVDAAVE
jgi:hypothetical protein